MNIYNVYDLNVKDNLNLYFSIKLKHNLSISESDYEIILKDIQLYVDKFDDYDYIIYPESSRNFVKDVVNLFDKNIIKIQLEKNDKHTILANILKLKLNKMELKSQINRINKMDKFKINAIKSNKRNIYIPYIFKHSERDFKGAKVLIVDDSMFTQNTIKAILNSLNLNLEDVDIFTVFK